MSSLTRKERILASGIGISLLLHYEHTKRHLRRRWWVRPWASAERRSAQGLAESLIPELVSTDQQSFQNFFR